VIPLREQEYIRQRFASELTGKVRIYYFTQRPSRLYVPGREECPYCEDTRQMLEELAALTGKINLSVHELSEAREEAARMGVDKVPGIVLRGPANRPLTFYGIPAGNEFPGFIETIVDASKEQVELARETSKQLRKLKKNVAITVFVTPTCPHCPVVGRAAYRLAMASPHIRATVVEASEFPRLAQRYGIRAVPTTVLDDRMVVTGAMDEAALLEQVLRAAEEGALAPGAAQAGAATATDRPGGPAAPTRGGRLILP
jgi:glutaredoxin-like protein